jgi:hypothetical protein
VISLHVFVDSDRPDQHLNSLVYCVLKRDVRAIKFYHIRGFPGSTNTDNDGLSGRILAAVQSQLEGLAERAEYSFKSGENKGNRILLKDEYGENQAREIQELYKRVREIAVSFSNMEIDYTDLRKLLGSIADQREVAYVDVTAIKKRYLGDIVAAGLVEGLGGLFTFDLTVIPDYDRPWKMLIHDLGLGTDRVGFEYTNLLETPMYKSCVRLVMVRTPRMRVWFGAAAALILVAGALYWFLGSDSTTFQMILVFSAVTSIMSFIMMFAPPRTMP